jgi:hypothetical protein
VAALKNVSPQLLPNKKLKMKLTTKSQIANVCRNYRPIAKKMPIVPMSRRHSTKPFVACSAISGEEFGFNTVQLSRKEQ